ncbi:MAG: hypothetical protein ABSA44_12680 [Bacteroidota bacterium]|jgi:hypothetical protein
MIKESSVYVFILMAVIIIGCGPSREESIYRQTDNYGACLFFLQEYPNSKYAPEVKNKSDKFRDIVYQQEKIIQSNIKKDNQKKLELLNNYIIDTTSEELFYADKWDGDCFGGKIGVVSISRTNNSLVISFGKVDMESDEWFSKAHIEDINLFIKKRQKTGTISTTFKKTKCTEICIFKFENGILKSILPNQALKLTE